MILLEDTRQQVSHGDKHRRKHEWWESHGVDVVRRKLDFGDYMREDGMSNISIDTKRDINEIAQNLGRDHDRLVREIERASADGYRLVFLIEAGYPYVTIDDIPKWTAKPCQMCERRRYGYCEPHSSMRCERFRFKPRQGQSVYRSMRAFEAHYGCRFEVVDPARSAARICEILGIEVTGRG